MTPFLDSPVPLLRISLMARGLAEVFPSLCVPQPPWQSALAWGVSAALGPPGGHVVAVVGARVGGKARCLRSASVAPGQGLCPHPDTAVTQTPAPEVLPLRWLGRLSPPAWQPWGPRWGAASADAAQTQIQFLFYHCLVVKSYILIYFRWLKISDKINLPAPSWSDCQGLNNSI